MTAVNWHLMFNHVPLLGLILGAVLLAYGVWQSQDDVQKVSLAVLAVAGLSAIGVYLTGEPAEELVEGLAGVSHDAIEAHEAFGLYSLIAGIATGVVSLWALAYSFMRQRLVRWTVVLSLVVALVSAGLIGYTANLGGKISHPELRGETVSTVEEGAETEGDETENSDERESNDDEEEG